MRIIKLLSCIIYIFSFTSIYAQSKYGVDSISCMENRAIYNMHYKQKNYDDALAPWRRAFNLCPESTENIFKHGPIIIKHRMKKDPLNKSAYLDTLMLIFDRRILYFGQAAYKEAYILGLKGYELVIADSKRSQEALDMLSRSIDIQGNKSGPQQVYGYLKAIVNLERLGLKTKEDVLDAYSYIMPIINYNIENKSKQTKYFIKYVEKVESMFANYADCDDLVALFSSKFNDLQGDVKFLKRAVDLLSENECIDSDLFFNLSSKLYFLDPSASSAYQMSKMSLTKGKLTNAITFAKEALAMEEDINNKAKYHLTLAEAYRISGSFSLARSEVYKALEINKGWGKAYITLGNIYVTGAKKCGGEFEQSAVYWIAVDAFRKALKDDKFKENASRSINIYSKQFPNKEACFFNGLEQGQTYSLECWINQSTIVRTRD